MGIDDFTTRNVFEAHSRLIVGLVHLLDDRGIISAKDVAAHFREQAERQEGAVQIIMRGIANGVDDIANPGHYLRPVE